MEKRIHNAVQGALYVHYMNDKCYCCLSTYRYKYVIYLAIGIRFSRIIKMISTSFQSISKSVIANRIRFFHNCVDVSRTVKDALDSRKPIVALETTIVSHGMPYPYNERTALTVEKIIIEQGVIPATIGVINGRIKVGMDQEMIHELADPETPKVKISKRDFPYVLSQRLNGGTTVAASLLVAKMVGIDIFVTGGIGGVHRDVTNSMDVSADLIELSRNPILVVSSGIKSILDIGRTLELLETLGVCVVSYGETKDFPAFYTRKSGFKTVYNVSEPKSAAELIYNVNKLASNSGILLGVPIPDEYSFDDHKMEVAIEEALRIADQKSIVGKDVTPFVLQYVNEITKGKSLESNIALIKNNALVGSKIAVQLRKKKTGKQCNLNGTKNTSSLKSLVYSVEMLKQPKVVVVGGSMMDIVVSSNENIKTDGRTISGSVSSTAGGVARNLVDGIGRLLPEMKPFFISVMGRDSTGEVLLESLKHVNTDGVLITNDNTACSVVMLDQQRDCSLVVADMDIHKLIEPQQIIKHEKVIANSSLVVFDANLSVDSMKVILQLSKKHNVKVWFEPTDLTVATKPFVISKQCNAIDYISPNFQELQAIVAYITNKPTKRISPIKSSNSIVVEARDLALEILPMIPNIIVTLGKNGLLVAKQNKRDDPKITFYSLQKQTSIESVSGAGDCLASGYIAAMLRGFDEEHCVSFGMSAAIQSLSSKQTVPSTLRYEPLVDDLSMKHVQLPITGDLSSSGAY